MLGHEFHMEDIHDQKPVHKCLHYQLYINTFLVSVVKIVLVDEAFTSMREQFFSSRGLALSYHKQITKYQTTSFDSLTATTNVDRS